MGKKLLKNDAAEREANDVAFRFMNSSDVVGDMRRAYTGRLDHVRLHDDASADAKVSAAGRDGIASGQDIYLKKGLLGDSAPETKGLIAHEMTHVLQQSGDSEGVGVQESISYGEEQGGFRDFFSGLFGAKKKLTPEEENEAALSGWAQKLGTKGIENLDISGPTSSKAIRHSVGQMAGEGGTTQDYLKQEYVSQLTQAPGESLSDDDLKYQDFLASDRFHVSRDLARDPKIQERAISEFVQGGQKVMGSAQTERSALELMRDNGTGMRGMTQLLSGLLPEDFNETIYQLGKNDTRGLDRQGLKSIRTDRVAGKQREAEALASGEFNDVVKMNMARGSAYGLIQQEVDKEGSEVGDVLGRAQAVFEGTKVTDQDKQSAFLMNMLLNRAITPYITDKARATESKEQADMMEEYNGWLQNGVKFDFGQSMDANPRKGFLQTLKRRFRRKGGKAESTGLSGLPSASGLF